MYFSIKISPKLQCRGRGGWFAGHQADGVICKEDEIILGVRSSTQLEDEAPITITGSVGDVQAMLQGLLDAINETVEARNKAIPDCSDRADRVGKMGNLVADLRQLG